MPTIALINTTLTIDAETKMIVLLYKKVLAKCQRVAYVEKIDFAQREVQPLPLAPGR